MDHKDAPAIYRSYADYNPRDHILTIYSTNPSRSGKGNGILVVDTLIAKNVKGAADSPTSKPSDNPGGNPTDSSKTSPNNIESVEVAKEDDSAQKEGYTLIYIKLSDGTVTPVYIPNGKAGRGIKETSIEDVTGSDGHQGKKVTISYDDDSEPFSFDIQSGVDGKNGKSPRIDVSEGLGVPGGVGTYTSIKTGYTLTIHNVDETTGEVAEEGNLVSSITIKNGEKGEKGDTGSQGPKGDKGDTGERGAQGVGIDRIGSQLSADGRNTEVSIVLTDNRETTFSIPSGVNGAPGASGPRGPKGEKGDQGDPGYSLSISKNETTGTTHTIVFSSTDPDKADETLMVSDGKQGPKGEKGKDGVSPTVTLEKDNSTGNIRVVATSGQGASQTTSEETIDIASIKQELHDYFDDQINSAKEYAAAAKASEDNISKSFISGQVTLTVTGWDEDTKKQSVTIEGLTSESLVITSPGIGSGQECADKNIVAVEQSDGLLTFEYASTKPAQDVKINYLIINKNIW